MSNTAPSDVLLTREQVRRIDRIASERYGIPGIVLMENAGRNAAEIVDRLYGPSGRAMIVCGTGNNGGDGCVIARHLHNRKWGVHVVIVGDEAKMSPDAFLNWRTVCAMELPRVITNDRNALVAEVNQCGAESVVIDSLLGTGFVGQMRSPLAELVETMNAARKRALVAVDVPSGFDCDTGSASNATIQADRTITFVAAKVGFAKAGVRAYVGDVEVVDIGAPRELIARVLRGED